MLFEGNAASGIETIQLMIRRSKTMIITLNKSILFEVGKVDEKHLL